MKKSKIGCLCIISLSCLLAACQGAPKNESSDLQESKNGQQNGSVSDNGTDKPDKITIISTTDDVALFEHVGGQYEEKYGIAVEVISQAYDNTHQKIATSFSGRTDADLVYVDVPWAAEFGDLGITMDLNSYMTEEFKASFVDATLEQLVYDGKTQAIPFANNGKWMSYNKKILEEGGYENPPATWDELESMSKDLMEQGLVKYGIAWAGKQAEGLICDMTTMLYAFGGQWMDDQGKMVFNSPEGVQGLSVMTDSIKEGWADSASLSYGDRENLDPFMAGDVAFVMNWSFAWELANDPDESEIAGDVGICLVPGNGTVTSAAVTGGGGIGIISTSDSPEYAWKFIEMLVSPDNQKFALENNGTLPTLKALYEDPQLLEKYGYLELMYPQYEYSQFRPQLADYSEWSTMLQPKISAALLGDLSPEEALDQAAEESLKFTK